MAVLQADMIEGAAPNPPSILFQRFWFWMLICLVFVGPALVSTGPVPLDVIGHSIVHGWIPFAAQAVLWQVVRRNVKRSNLQRALCFLLPMVSAGWLLFEYSWFYGRPRKVMIAALKEPAPLVFWPVEFEDEAWTDYSATLRVILDKDYLRKALEKHFERSQYEEGKTYRYYRKDAEQREWESCTVETDAEFSYAEITYGVD